MGWKFFLNGSYLYNYFRLEILFIVSYYFFSLYVKRIGFFVCIFITKFQQKSFLKVMIYFNSATMHNAINIICQEQITNFYNLSFLPKNNPLKRTLTRFTIALFGPIVPDCLNVSRLLFF